MSQEVTITFLGGLGDIGRNCAAIETDDSTVGNWSDHYPMGFRIDAR